MESNSFLSPYRSPGRGNAAARWLVAGPALGLMVTSGVWNHLLILALCADAFMLGSGMGDELLPERRPPGISRETMLVIRMVLSCLALLAGYYVFSGAKRMRRLQDISMARNAAILAIIPCTGPCYLVGIPFGLWALIVLAMPNVQKAFDS